MEVTLEREGVNRYRVSNPFQFDDGDHLVIMLKKEQDRWLFSDEAHTWMRLSFNYQENDLLELEHERRVSNAISEFQMEDRDGELVLFVSEERYGESLYSFILGILKASNVSYLPDLDTDRSVEENHRN